MGPHELAGLIKSRRSIRKFKSQPVPASVISSVVEAGIWAPSACNQTPVRFVVIDRQSDLSILNQVKPEIANPQAAILVVLDLGGEFYQKWFTHPHTRQNPILDVGAAMQNMALVVHAHGLASCWTNFSPYIDSRGCEPFFRRFRLPPSCRISSVLFLGYPDQEIDVQRHAHHQRVIDRGAVENYFMKIPPRILLVGAHPADFDNLGSQAMTNGMKHLIERKYAGAQYAALEYPWKNPWKFFPGFRSLDEMRDGQLQRFLLEVDHLHMVAKMLRDERDNPGPESLKERLIKYFKLGMGLLLKRPFKPSFPRYQPGLNDPLAIGLCSPLPMVPEGIAPERDGWLAVTAARFSRLLDRQIPAFINKRMPHLAMLLFRYQFRYVQPAYLSRLSAMAWADIVFFDGNGLFSDDFHWSQDTMLRFLAECLCSKRLGAKVYVVNQTVSVSRPWLNEIIAHVYNEMDGIVAREPFSQEKMLEMGIKRPLLFLGADAATWADYAVEDLLHDESWAALRSQYADGIALCIRGDLTEDVRMWSALVTELFNRTQRPVLYIPSSRNDDMSLAQAIAASSPLQIVRRITDYRQAFFMMQSLRLVISSRYHPLYFSLAAEVPFVAVRGNTFKIDALLKMLHYPLPVIHPGESHRDQVLEQVEYVIAHREALRLHLRKHMATVKADAELNVDVAEKKATGSRWANALNQDAVRLGNE